MAVEIVLFQVDRNGLLVDAVDKGDLALVGTNFSRNQPHWIHHRVESQRMTKHRGQSGLVMRMGLTYNSTFR